MESLGRRKNDLILVKLFVDNFIFGEEVKEIGEARWGSFTLLGQFLSYWAIFERAKVP